MRGWTKRVEVVRGDGGGINESGSCEGWRW